MSNTTKKTWDVWVASEMRSFRSARRAMAYYCVAQSQRGEALCSIERDGWRAIDECREAAEIEHDERDARRVWARRASRA